jgi:hypothetical protein
MNVYSLLENAIAWLMILVFMLMLCGMVMALIRNMLKMAFGAADETEDEAEAKPTYKAKREPGRVKPKEVSPEPAAATASFIADDAEEFELADARRNLPVRRATTPMEPALEERLVNEFEAQQVPAST